MLASTDRDLNPIFTELLLALEWVLRTAYAFEVRAGKEGRGAVMEGRVSVHVGLPLLLIYAVVVIGLRVLCVSVQMCADACCA